MTATVTVSPHEEIARIAPELYGHFAEHLGHCVYGGLWVGEDSPIANDGGLRLDVIGALRKMSVPVLRWPGGCFADDYHWENGVGARENRPLRINAWWGGERESNAFGTHEFMQLCRAIGAQPYLAGNLGSGSPREMSEWVEYCNFGGDSNLSHQRARNGDAEPFRVKYWGVGNENWGCGGDMTADDYASVYRRFSVFLRDFPGAPLHLIACGPNRNDTAWTHRFLEKITSKSYLSPPRIHGFAAHYYTANNNGSEQGQAGSATHYDENHWYSLLRDAVEVENLIVQQREIMDVYDPQRRIQLMLDEWGTWHCGGSGPTEGALLQQQNTMRDALVASLSLDIFNRHADKIAMGNIAQLTNVLQSPILTDGDKMLLTPTYHVFEMMQAHQGGASTRIAFATDDIAFTCGGSVAPDRHGTPRAGGIERTLAGLSGSASLKDGTLTLSVTNPHAREAVDANLRVLDAEIRATTARVLCADSITAHNTFAAPENVAPRDAAIAPPRNGEWRHTFPPASVTVISARLA